MTLMQVPVIDIAPFRDDLANYALNGYHHFETRILETQFNWKLVIDTFLETYHLNTLHRQTIAPLLHSNLNTFTPMDHHLRMVAARKTYIICAINLRKTGT